MSDIKPGSKNASGVSEISRRELLLSTAAVAGGTGLLAAPTWANVTPDASNAASNAYVAPPLRTADGIDLLELVL